MNLEKYTLKAEDSLMVYEFTSLGPKGTILKLIKFSETNLKDLYNLGFGDKDLETGDVNDLAISDNGDSEKILASVVSAVFAFTDHHPNAYVYATGSTKARTRLYRMGISKHLKEIVKEFDVYGLINNEWEKFEKETDYEAFLAKRKKVTLHYEH